MSISVLSSLLVLEVPLLAKRQGGQSPEFRMEVPLEDLATFATLSPVS